MQRQIYSSSESDSLLKSVGPRRQKSSDLSFSGVIVPQHRNVTTEFVKGTVQTYEISPSKTSEHSPVFVLPTEDDR
jgi:hypothetical protein